LSKNRPAKTSHHSRKPKPESPSPQSAIQPIRKLQSERLRRQQRRRPRSVRGLIRRTPFLSQQHSSKFFDIFVTD
jgi:hypothetical protein